MASSSPTASPPSLDYLLVLDFEATCEKDVRLTPQEIIEFPVLLVNAKTGLTERVFHEYVRPAAHPKLTAFCTELTGITQEMVDNGKPFEEVIRLFEHWMVENGLVSGEKRFAFVTCGDWDLKTCLPGHLQYIGEQPAPYFREWINLKIAFSDLYGERAYGMTTMLDYLGLKLEGRHHSGIDDCRNIARVAVQMLEDGWKPALTWHADKKSKGKKR